VNVSTRAALAVSSGLALALAFPKFDVSFAAWVAFVPLLYAIDGESHRNVFLYSWLQGFACYVGSISWVTITLHHFADVPLVLALLPMMLLAAVIAFFTGAAVWAAAFVTARRGISMVATLPIAWAAKKKKNKKSKC